MSTIALAARGRGGADRVDDRRDALALVEVGAAQEHQQVAVADRTADASGSCRCGRRRPAALKPGRSVVAISAVASPERVDGRQPARAQHEGDVVALDAGELGEPRPSGGLVGELVAASRHAASVSPAATASQTRSTGRAGGAARRRSRRGRRRPRRRRRARRGRTRRAGRPRRRRGRRSTRRARRSASRPAPWSCGRARGRRPPSRRGRTRPRG